jgi:KUP system potassium uptake protein
MESVAPASAGHAPRVQSSADLLKVGLAALGVVYGDIGTSPLYAIKECFSAPHGVANTHHNVLGVLSLVFWSLTFVIVIKYLSFIMRADNRGQGGILALFALVQPRSANERKLPRGAIIVMLGLAGASLLYGEGVITPAISVLSAVEGLGVATHALDPVVIPVTVAILLALFLVQKRGTAGIGAVFGPTMLVWFVCIAAVSVPWIVRHPGVLAAVNPLYAVEFFRHNGGHGFLLLGSVVLCITGAEALYADMGHFGKKPIRFAWYVMVFPALLTNYFGQGALMLANEGKAVANPFYALAPSWFLYPMVAIATAATIVASQALISGAFSLTQQAVQLGYLPRVNIVHTSGDAEGQIYIPEVNYGIMVACIALVLGFKSSSALAAAYGIAVTGTFCISSVLLAKLAITRWRWSYAKTVPLIAAFLVADVSFFTSNLPKITSGGWLPIVLGSATFVVFTTWKRGRDALGRFMREATLPLDAFMADVKAAPPQRVKGTAVFMTSNPDGAPPVLLHHFKHNKVLHRQVILLSITTEHEPEVPPAERLSVVKDLGEGFYQVTAAYGFMQTPNVLDVLAQCSEQGVGVDRADTSYYLGRETLLITSRPGMARWRKYLFAFLSKNARPANAFFHIPPNRVVELGTQIEL